jgi:hypothetical protein
MCHVFGTIFRTKGYSSVIPQVSAEGRVTKVTWRLAVRLSGARRGGRTEELAVPGKGAIKAGF